MKIDGIDFSVKRAKKMKKEDWIKLNTGICEDIDESKREIFLSECYDRLVSDVSETKTDAKKTDTTKPAPKGIQNF